jgi:diguanylate cyclase (GGDEF)-like protein/PAS domain S-box-containing protein
VLLVALTGAALALSRLSLRQAMDGRVADRVEVVRRLSRGGDTAYASEALAGKARSSPFSPDDPAGNGLLLQTFITTQGGDAPVAALVVADGGEVVGSRPAAVPLPRPVVDTLLAGTRAGRIELSASFELDGALVWARGYPLGGEEPWGALVMVEPITDGWLQRLYERMGPLGPGDGGMTLLDRRGVAVASWDPARLGSRPLPRAELVAASGSPVVSTVELGGRRTVRIAQASAEDADGGLRLFEQSEDDLFADLRRAQGQRDRGVLAVGATAVVALAAFGSLRQRAVRRSEARSSAILRHAGDLVLVVDDGGHLRYVSPAAGTLLDRDPLRLVDRPLVGLVADADATLVATALAELPPAGEATLLGVRLRTGDGDPAWFDLALADRRHDPHVAGVLVTCHEVGERKRLEEELAHQAGHDALTGLANRVRFDEVLAERVATGRPLAVMIVDLDRVKQLNDGCGHAAGDAALCAVADALRRVARDGDLVARLGGDEFGLVVADAAGEGAAALASRVIGRVRAVRPAGADGAGLDASVGIAVTAGGSPAPGAVVRAADAAMYRAKRAGGGRSISVVLDATPGAVGDGTGAPASSAASSSAPPGDDRPAGGGGARAADDPGVVGDRPRPLSSRLRDAGVVLVAGSVVVAVAAVGLVQSGQHQRAAEEQRIAERTALLTQIADIAGTTTDARKLVPFTAALPWDTAPPELLHQFLREYATSPSMGPRGMSALLTAEGRVVATYPMGAIVGVDTTDGWWAGALEGRAYTPVIRDDGEVPRFSFVVPVVRDGQPVEHVVVIGASVPDTAWSSSLTAMGAVRPGPGGISVVDAAGVASSSWDQRSLGRRVVEPAWLRDLRPGERRVQRDVVDGEEVVTIAVRVPSSRRCATPSGSSPRPDSSATCGPVAPRATSPGSRWWPWSSSAWPRWTVGGSGRWSPAPVGSRPSSSRRPPSCWWWVSTGGCAWPARRSSGCSAAAPPTWSARRSTTSSAAASSTASGTSSRPWRPRGGQRPTTSG